MTQLSCDVAVIGAGSAGLSTAVSAAESGARVVVLEKTGRLGGAIQGGSGLFAAGSHVQRERQVALTRDAAFARLMEFTQWRVDARLVSDYVNASADTIAWFEEMGAVFSDVVAYYLGAERTWHYREPASPELAGVLERRARSLGVEFHVDSPVSGLSRGSGARPWTVAAGAGCVAGAVVLATGGFGGSPELIERYTGFRHGVDLFSFAYEECAGDGIRLAAAAGAGSAPAMMETYVCLPPPHWGPGGTGFDLGSFRQPNLMVNARAERFMNEEVMRIPSFAANAVARQPGRCGYMILDRGVNEGYEREGWDFQMSKLPVTRPVEFAATVAKARAEGYPHLFEAGSLDELAAATGLDPGALGSTVDEYRQACRTGRDAAFFKAPAYLRPLDRPPFYAARFGIGGYGSLGGVPVDHRLRVLDPAGEPVAGLYAAGRDANAIYGGSYPFVMAGNSSSFSHNSGRLAGRHAAGFAAAERDSA
ncbi:MAG TPA: FAD-dependent oxidoreductase [Rugosimonospora sp.]|nr:FAD-dependent oxidoreductase [Rugosimonospora sp.]